MARLRGTSPTYYICDKRLYPPYSVYKGVQLPVDLEKPTSWELNKCKSCLYREIGSL